MTTDPSPAVDGHPSPSRSSGTAAPGTVPSAITASADAGLYHLRCAYPALKPADVRVADAILEDPKRAASESITSIASRSGTVASTVSRLARRLGYSGYPAFRAAIATEVGRTAVTAWEQDIGTDIRKDDSPDQVLETLANTQIRALSDVVARLDTSRVRYAAEKIAHARHVHMYADLGDAIPLRELQLRLLRIGVASWFHESGPSTLHWVASVLDPRDVVLVLNRGGDNPVGIKFLQLAHDAGATTIAIHGKEGSDIAGAADVALYSGVYEGAVWADYFAGRASDTLVTSLLWVLVSQTHGIGSE